MTVKTLIEKLKELPEDLRVFAYAHEEIGECREVQVDTKEYDDEQVYCMDEHPLSYIVDIDSCVIIRGT